MVFIGFWRSYRQNWKRALFPWRWSKGIFAEDTSQAMGSLWIPCLKFVRWIEQKMKCFLTWFGFSHSSWSWATHCSDRLLARARYPPWRVFKFSVLDWQKTVYHHAVPSPWRAFSGTSTMWSPPHGAYVSALPEFPKDLFCFSSGQKMSFPASHLGHNSP